jgi:hypothetical protein
MRRSFGKLAGFWPDLCGPFHYGLLLISGDEREAALAGELLDTPAERLDARGYVQGLSWDVGGQRD